MSKLRPVSLFSLAAVGFMTATAGAHEEDWRKLADRMPPFLGPIVTAETADASQLRSGSGVSLLSQVPVNNFPGSSNEVNDCWGYVSPSGREYALVGLQCGLGVVDITDPINPFVLGTINGPCSPWRDVKTIGEYAFVVSEGGGGMQVVDLSLADSGIINLVTQFTEGGYSTTHNIVADEDSNFVYLVGSNIANGGLVAVDVSNPTNPVFAGSWAVRYVHDAQVITYTTGPLAGRQIAYCYNGGSGLEILDVTDKSAMFGLGNTSYAQIAYTHQGWLDESGTYAYLNDELDEQSFGLSQTNSRIIDVSDPTNPVFVGSFSSGQTAIDHNNYVEGDFLFQANYRSGLQVFDISNPTNPQLVGSFDTFPGTGNSFNGAWSVYPFLPSRNIIVSDIESGLFVLQVDAFNPAELTVTVDVFPGDSLNPGEPTPVEAIVADGASTLEPGSVRLAYSVGEDPEAEIPMTDLGGGRFGANLPAFDCFESVRFQVVADSASGVEIRSDERESFVRTGSVDVFADSFAGDLGWSTTTGGATGGAWERGAPAGDGSRGDPTSDFDGDNACYLTENASGNTDVDGGPVILTSPTTIDLGPDSVVSTLSYAYWVYSTGGESLSVEASADGGSTWESVALHAGDTSPAWIQNSVDLPPASGTDLRVRFSIGDNPNNDVTEAAVDAIVIEAADCEFTPVVCAADLTTDGTSNGIPDGVATLSDFSFYLSLWSNGDPAADVTTDGGCTFGAGGDGVTLSDFSCYLSTWSAGCP
ncbi:MAG: choice-of-anchor B family protein [Planctomycetota bacterium]